MFWKIVALGTPPMIKAQQRNLQTIARASCQEKGQREKLHPKQWIAVSRVAFTKAFKIVSTGCIILKWTKLNGCEG